MGSERIESPLTIEQSLDTRDAMAKTLYSSLFSWICSRINRIVYKESGSKHHIALLDIFGFEDLQVNRKFPAKKKTFFPIIIKSVTCYLRKIAKCIVPTSYSSFCASVPNNAPPQKQALLSN